MGQVRVYRSAGSKNKLFSRGIPPDYLYGKGSQFNWENVPHIYGVVAQLGERLVCIQKAEGSNPFDSINVREG